MIKETTTDVSWLYLSGWLKTSLGFSSMWSLPAFFHVFSFFFTAYYEQSTEKQKPAPRFNTGIPSSDYKKLVICVLLFLVAYTFCWSTTSLNMIPGLEEEWSNGKAVF